MLCGLALAGGAARGSGKFPGRKARADRLLLFRACLLPAVTLLIVLPTSMAAFTGMAALASLCCIFLRSMILAASVVWRKKHSEPHAAARYSLSGSPLSCRTALQFLPARLG